MSKFFKIITITFLSILIIFLVLFSTYLIITGDAKLDINKLVGAGQNIAILDGDGNEIANASLVAQKKSISINNLQQHTIDAFIASEDRTFYKHNGLNIKRMLKAVYKNVTSRSFKEGASTISQQLVKNTHLSNDKTIKRKLKEIRLTKQLEKSYDKTDILEMYLNTIYFGHNCYGLQRAAEFYFNKHAENLTLNESSTIVGLLTSPNNYSPFKNPDKCLSRRNIVLKNMLDCKFIDNTTYEKEIKKTINATKPLTNNTCGEYIDGIFAELENLDYNYYALCNGCTVKTYLDFDLQKFIENTPTSCDNGIIIIDNKFDGIKAYKSTIGENKRQPGSTVKPIFVYAPALEEKLISPLTKILDEKIDYNGYSPENFNKKYCGYVSVEDSIKNSLNIPAVKTLNALTISVCEKYLKSMDVSLCDEEKNLSLALGGMKYGLSLKELVDKYTIFANQGKYRPSHFIKEIISKEGKIIYKDDYIYNSVFSKGVCSLMNDMLIKTTKSGTAKKLKDFNFDIASKTGTCGNTEGNTDAYAVSYTSEHSIGVWLGDKNNKRSNITGGGECCDILKRILSTLYNSHTPQPLDTQTDTTTVDLDREEYEKNNKFVLADSLCPKLNILKAKVLKGNEPSEKSSRFFNPKINSPTISVENNTINIELCQTKYYSYIVKRKKDNKISVIYEGKWKNIIVDSPKEQGIYTYTVTPYYSCNNNKFYGNEVILPQINISSSNSSPIKLPEIIYEEWYKQ